MAHPSWHQRPPPRRSAPAGAVPPDRKELMLVAIDLRRADLYRILDEFARAPPGRREEVIREFEQAWEAFKTVISKAG